MKNKLCLLLPLVLCLTACHSITIPTKQGPATVTSFAQKVSIAGLVLGPDGTLSLTNYNLDQVSGIQAISAAINSGIAAGATGVATGGMGMVNRNIVSSPFPAPRTRSFVTVREPVELPSGAFVFTNVTREVFTVPY